MDQLPGRLNPAPTRSPGVPTTCTTALRILVASVCMASLAPCFAQNLVVNGGFEAPVVAVASPQLYRTGADVAGWTVVGETGNVALLNGDFTQLGLKFTPHEGAQSIDLTGITNTDTGIAQSIPTVAGAVYELSFHVGNVQAPDAAPWGNVSSIRVLLNGAPLATAIHDGGPANELGWRGFSHQFTATGASSRIAFVNSDSQSDHVSQLDDVRVVAAVSASGTLTDDAIVASPRVPAPDHTVPWWIFVVVLLAVGIVALFVVRSRRR